MIVVMRIPLNWYWVQDGFREEACTGADVGNWAALAVRLLLVIVDDDVEVEDVNNFPT
jgi:hypothetical protein